MNGVDAVIDSPQSSASSWSATVPLTAGQNTLTPVAKDARGNEAQASVKVNNVEPPVVVLSQVAIGGPGFNVDQVGSLGDIAPDNALIGLGSVANPMIADKMKDNASPLILMFQFVGLAQLPGPGDPAVTVTINGYIGEDTDGDASNNFSGTANFKISPDSYDAVTGLPKIRFENAKVYNDYGHVRIRTYPGQPSFFQLAVSSGETPLVIRVQPAFIDIELIATANGIGIVQNSLLGGVVPASDLAVNLDVSGQQINPLAMIIRDDPNDPAPDVDLNKDGKLSTKPADANADNPDGVSVGIQVGGTSCHIVR